MEGPIRSIEIGDLHSRSVAYQYRYCPRCRREWPAKHQSCPECVHWLGDRPLTRIEWQVSPQQGFCSVPQNYELVGASALILRLVRDARPSGEQSVAVAAVIGDLLAVANGAVRGIAGYGWLVWTRGGLRQAFRVGREIEQRLKAFVPQLERALQCTAGIRWAIWIDQYLVQFDKQNSPVIGDITAKAIFDFEPDNMLLSSEAVYQVNRPWEHFVGSPRRLLDGQEPYGYRLLGHKRPSALDHAEATQTSAFVGRKRQLLAVENCWKSVGPTVKLAVSAPAGSGKTRLIREWLGGHPQLRAIVASFSLFGGGIEQFAGQLAELPPDRLDRGALIQAVLGRVERDMVNVLVLDDLHWADSESLQFLDALLAGLPLTGMFIILLARPSGRKQLQALRPTSELKLNPLPPPAAAELARRLSDSDAVAAAAALRCKGSPLFIEQFVAWAAEANFRGGQSGPYSLHHVIAARIDHLSKVRIADIRQRLRWSGSWQRQAIDNELGELEREVGLWLDRLETGDYADRVEAARHLNGLERLDYDIFLTSMLVGRPRPRSSRLREAIERLLLGSADEVLADLRRRAAQAKGLTREEISRAAHRAADVLFAAFKWTLARDFYELAYSDALWDKNEIGRRLIECSRRGRKTILDDAEVDVAFAAQRLEEKPRVSAIELPYIWADLGRLHHSSRYFEHASVTASAVNDTALANWAKRKALECGRCE